MNFQERIGEVMIQRLSRSQPEIETASVNAAGPLRDGDDTQGFSDNTAAVAIVDPTVDDCDM